MRKMVFSAIALAIVGGIGVSGISSAYAERGRQQREEDDADVRSSVRIPSKEAHLASLSKISIEDAVKSARAAETGVVVAAELEAEDGYLYWSVEIVREDGTFEAVIDPGNGKVLSVERDDDEEECESEDESDEDEEDEDEDEDEEEEEESEYSGWGRGRYGRHQGRIER